MYLVRLSSRANVRDKLSRRRRRIGVSGFE